MVIDKKIVTRAATGAKTCTRLLNSKMLRFRINVVGTLVRMATRLSSLECTIKVLYINLVTSGLDICMFDFLTKLFG